MGHKLYIFGTVLGHWCSTCALLDKIPLAKRDSASPCFHVFSELLFCLFNLPFRYLDVDLLQEHIPVDKYILYPGSRSAMHYFFKTNFKVLYTFTTNIIMHPSKRYLTASGIQYPKPIHVVFAWSIQTYKSPRLLLFTEDQCLHQPYMFVCCELLHLLYVTRT